MCSDVYYVFPHKETSLAVKITTSDKASANDSFTVSFGFDHILYVGESFEVSLVTQALYLFQR